MKTIEEKIAVMQAFADGKEIEFTPNSSCGVWTSCKDPNWDWPMYDYRIKEKPKDHKYVPFSFEDAKLLIGKAIKEDVGAIYTILSIQNSGVVVIHPLYKIVSYTWEELIRKFKFFPDGSICGKLKQQ